MPRKIIISVCLILINILVFAFAAVTIMAESIEDTAEHNGYIWFIAPGGYPSALLYDGADGYLLICSGSSADGLAEYVRGETGSIDALVIASDDMPENETEELSKAVNAQRVFSAADCEEPDQNIAASFNAGSFAVTLYSSGGETLCVYVAFEDLAMLFADAAADMSVLEDNTELAAMDLLSVSARTGLSKKAVQMIDPYISVLSAYGWADTYQLLHENTEPAGGIFCAQDPGHGFTLWLGRAGFEPENAAYAETMLDAIGYAKDPSENDDGIHTDIKTDFEAAVEVMNGYWGAGAARADALYKAGYDPAVIQSLVDKLYDPSLGVLAGVVFDTCGHGIAPGPQLISAGTKAAMPQEPAEEGYIFTGWFSDKEHTVPFDFEEPVDRTVTVYAGWTEPETEMETENKPQELTEPETEPVVYTVCFENEETYSSSQIREGENAGMPETPFKEGYVFDGWRTGNPEGDIYDFSLPVLADITLYASWREAEYTIRFEPNGGTGEMPDLLCPVNSETVMPDCAYLREGYSFMSWNSQPKGNGEEFLPGAVSGPLAPEDGAVITLYAQWKENPVILEGNGQEWSGTDDLEFVTNGGLEDLKRVTVDTAPLKKDEYTLWANSFGIHIILAASYLEKLEPGKHIVRFEFADDSADTGFEICETSPDDQGPEIKSLWPVFAGSFLAIGLIILIITGIKRRKTGRG